MTYLLKEVHHYNITYNALRTLHYFINSACLVDNIFSHGSNKWSGTFRTTAYFSLSHRSFKRVHPVVLLASDIFIKEYYAFFFFEPSEISHIFLKIPFAGSVYNICT